MAEWFRRKDKNINTSSRREIAEGLWVKCYGCQHVIYKNSLIENLYVCSECSYHFRMPCEQYIKMLIDDDFENIASNIISDDPLSFEAVKKYKKQLEEARDNNKLSESIQIVRGNLNGLEVILCVMDFTFIGGSMGSALGERLVRGISVAQSKQLPLIIISSSGGARMQEGAYSLMQLAKISTKLASFSDAGGFYLSLLTDPTYGGASASFSMQGDLILAEPNSLIGFAGKRVIKQTIGEDLPDGFQTSEFLLQRGFIDYIVNRKEMKKVISDLILFFNTTGSNEA